MAAKFVVFVALLALASAAMVRRDAPAPADNDLKAELDAFLQQATTFGNTLKASIDDASGTVKQTLEATKNDLDKKVNDLRKAHPEVEQQAGKLSEQAQAAVQSGIQELQKLAKDVQSKADVEYQKLAPAFKEAADNVAKSAVELQKKFQDATKQ